MKTISKKEKDNRIKAYIQFQSESLIYAESRIEKSIDKNDAWNIEHYTQAKLIILNNLYLVENKLVFN
jgi:hypothetical protein